MLNFDSMQRRVRGRLARMIAPTVQRSEPDPQPIGYYPQASTCQIPTLGFLLERFLGKRDEGTFVEIGANDGVYASNTWGLAERAWRGWMVEPLPQLAALCRMNHSSHQVRTYQMAIAGDGVSEVRLIVAGVLTTANPALAEEYSKVGWAQHLLSGEEIVVPAKSARDFFRDEAVPADLDVLVVDVEGFEAEVFSTFDFGECAPKMLIVELADTHADLLSTASVDAQLSRRISDAGYRIVYKDHINTAFVRDDIWREAYGLSDAV